jgi:hypothetical protein
MEFCYHCQPAETLRVRRKHVTSRLRNLFHHRGSAQNFCSCGKFVGGHGALRCLTGSGSMQKPAATQENEAGEMNVNASLRSHQ